ncbi:uncharacterized protein LOC124169102 isoform X3 [Ischnura elegans]|nr:uncharacterized protein LOC124169102 isoform X3 [Ischnura elegans]
MWIVVHFLEENSVEVVPTSWYSGGKCRWPNIKGVERLRGMVEKEVEPQDSWLTFKANTVGQRMYCSLQKAREKCSLAEDTSDLTSDAEKGVGKRKRHEVRWSSDSEEEEQRTSSTPRIPMPPKLVENREDQTAPSPVSNSASASDTPCGNCLKRSSFEEELMRAVTFIKHSVIDMNKRLSTLEAPATISVNETEVLNTILGSYPIASHIQLLEEEKKLLDGTYKQQLTSELSIIGGNSPKDMAKRILRALMTDSVAADYSWLGQKKKKVFSVLLLKDVIFDVFRKSKWSGTTNKDIETFVKDWLRHAKFRCGGNEKSLTSDGNVNTTDV